MSSILSLLGFKEAIEKARGAPTVPRLVEWIGGRRIGHDPHLALVDGKPFVPGECYFSLRLSGLHLQNSRHFTQEVLPLCICLVEFRRSGKPQSVPFSLGPDTIRQRLEEVKAAAPANDVEKPRSGWVELRDIEINHPMPVSLANVEAFIGLYEVPGDDVARTLLNVMGTISQAFGGAVAPALAIAEKVYAGFTTLLGVNGVTPAVEALHGSILRQSGYLLVSNAPEDSPLKGKLFVSGGRLRKGEEPDAPLVTDFDYCLLAIQRHETVVEASSTAPDLFGTQWLEVVGAFDGPQGAAEAAFKRLQRTIYGSTELIARDRDAVLAGYLLEYDKAARVLGTAQEAKGLTRGLAVENVLSAVTDIPQLYGPLAAAEIPTLTKQEMADLKAGSSAWTRAAELRSALTTEPPGIVADTIIRAQA
jgi:hypothetical protein